MDIEQELACPSGQQNCWDYLEVYDPKPWNPQQQDYLTSHVQSFVSALHSATPSDETTGYPAFLDVRSFATQAGGTARMALVTEREEHALAARLLRVRRDERADGRRPPMLRPAPRDQKRASQPPSEKQLLVNRRVRQPAKRHFDILVRASLQLSDRVGSTSISRAERRFGTFRSGARPHAVARLTVVGRACRGCYATA